MDHHQLKVFLAVAEELHFGRAAQALHLAQPAVSRAVAQLEKSLGTTLFERSTRRVSLTAAGQQLVVSGQRIMQSIDEAKALVLAAQDGERGNVSIVFAGVSTHRLIATLSRELKRVHPRITTALHSQNFAQQALDRVLDEEVDIGLGRWDFVPADLESHPVHREDLVLAVPADHDLAEAASVSFAELADQPFIELTNAQSVLHDRLRRLAHACGFEPTVIQDVPDTWTALTLVGAGIGCTLTLDSVQSNFHESDVRFIPVSDEYESILLRMAWLPGNRNPVLRHVLELAETVWDVPGLAAGPAEARPAAQ